MFSKPILKSTNEVEIDEERYFIRFVLTSGINSDDLYMQDEKSDGEDEEDEEDSGEEDIIDEE